MDGPLIQRSTPSDCFQEALIQIEDCKASEEMVLPSTTDDRLRANFPLFASAVSHCYLAYLDVDQPVFMDSGMYDFSVELLALIIF
jgi:hypothetical protein